MTGTEELNTGNETSKETSKETSNESENRPEEVRNRRKQIMDLMTANPGITAKEIADRLDITQKGVWYHINRMRKEGIIKHEGPTKSGRWIIL